jgi:hypothetical protein
VTPTPQDYIQLAQRLHPSLLIDREIETVDLTEDGLGAYVQAQVWIPAYYFAHNAPAAAGESNAS